MSGTFDFQAQPDKYRERAIAIMQLGQQIERQLVSLYEQSITAISSGFEPGEVHLIMQALDNLDPPKKRAAKVVQAAQRFASFLVWSQLVESPMKPPGVEITVVGEDVTVTVLPSPPVEETSVPTLIVET